MTVARASMGRKTTPGTGTTTTAYSELDQVASLAVVGIVDGETFSCSYDVLAARRTCATAPPKDPAHVSVGHGDGSAPWVADPPLVAHGLSCRSVPVGQLPYPAGGFKLPAAWAVPPSTRARAYDGRITAHPGEGYPPSNGPRCTLL